LPGTLREADLARILSAMIRNAALAASLLAVLVLSGCSGGDSSPKPAATATATAGEPQIPSVVHSGDLSTDHTLDAALAPDPIEMARLAFYQHTACAARADAEHPGCFGNESPGDNVEAFPKTGCERGWVRPADLPPLFAGALQNRELKLAGIYEPAAGVDAFGANAIGVVLNGTHDDGTGSAVAVHIKAGRIVTFEDDCGAALKLVDQSRVARWIIAPGQAAANAAATP
jgi:hypothetical protein